MSNIENTLDKVGTDLFSITSKRDNTKVTFNIASNDTAYTRSNLNGETSSFSDTCEFVIGGSTNDIAGSTTASNDILNSSMLFTSTHDISRAINIIKCDDFNKNGEWRWNLYNESLDYCKNYKLEDRKKAKDLYKAYISMIMFMPGILSIFYGDEIGMEGMGNLA